MNGSNFKNETLFVSFTAVALLPEMGEMAQTFMLEIEWLAALKCRATGCRITKLDLGLEIDVAEFRNEHV